MKNKYLKARLTESEKNRIDTFCRENGITTSEFVREIIKKRDEKTVNIIGKEARMKERALIYNVIYQLQKIGVNINQISHYFNLKHLKNLERAKSLEDMLIIDELKKEQLQNIRQNLKTLQQIIKNLTESINNAAKD